MSGTRQIAESPSQIVTRYYDQHIKQAGKGQIGNYCLGVAIRYNRLHADSARTLPFDITTGTLGQIQDRAAKAIGRWMDPTTTQHFPLDAVMVCVDELPDEVRRDCWVEVMRSIGHLAVRCPDSDSDPCETFGFLLEVFGELTQAAAPVIADGIICPKDRPHAPKVLQKIDKMEAALASWRRAILQNVLGE